MAAELQSTPDFSHTLCILPPVVDGGQVLWFAYLDEQYLWRRSYATVDELLSAAADILCKLLVFERTNPGGKNPNYTPGMVRELPNLPPRWRVRVTAECREDDPEWTVELLDASAWAASGYDFREIMPRLAQRLRAANVTMQPLLSRVTPSDPPATHAQPKSPGHVSGSIEATVAAGLTRVERELADEGQQLLACERRIRELHRERRGLRAALAAYRKHAGTPATQKALPAPEAVP